MSGNKLIFKNTIVLYVKLIVSSIVGLFTSRYTIDALGLSDYGLYSIVGGIVIIISFVNTIMIAATYRFIAYEIGKKDEGNVNKIYNICFSIHVVFAILVLFLNEVFGVYYIENFLNTDINRLNDAVFVLRLSALATSFTILSIPSQGLLTAHENFLFRSLIEIFRSFFGLGIAIFLLNVSGNKLRIFAVLIAVANMLPTLFYFFYCRIWYLDNVKFKLYKDIKKYKEILSFTGWNILGAASVVGQNAGTPILINSFFGTTMNASYSIGYQVKGIISQFATNLAQAAVPQITKNYSSGNSDKSINIVSYTSKYTWFLMLFPVLPLLLETKYLLNIWLVHVPNYAIEFTRLLIIFTLVNGLGNGIGAIIQATGNIKIFQIILSATTLIGLPVGYFFYNSGYNATSIIHIFIITALINVFVVQIVLNKLIQFDVKSFVTTSYLRIVYVVISLAPIFIFSNYFHEGLFRFILNSTISIIWLLCSIYFFGLDIREKLFLKTYFLTLKNKLF